MDGSFDSDACVPFLLSRIGLQGDISAITSPCFRDARTPESKISGSLFSRLSRSVENNTGKQPIANAAAAEARREAGERRPSSPSLSRIDLSTIKAEESLPAKKKDASGQKSEGGSGQASRQGSGERRRSLGSTTEYSFSCGEISTPVRVSQAKRFSRGQQSYEGPASSVRISGKSRNARHLSDDEQREANFACISGADRSVSWDINPSTKHCAVSSELAKESSFRGLETSNGSLSNDRFKDRNRSRSAADEWREVEDPETGRPSPSLSRIDLLTIKAEESPLTKKKDANRQKSEGGNGQVSQQGSGERRLSLGSTTDYSFSCDEISTPVRLSQTKRFYRGQLSYERPASSARISGESRNARHVSDDEQREANCTCTSGVDRSVSWDTNPSTKHCAVSSELSKEPSFQGLETSNQSLNGRIKDRNRSRNAADEWREVEDPETGRKYYYNRKTRVSKWRLPKGAVLVKKASNRDPDQSHSAEENQFATQIDHCSGDSRLRMSTNHRSQRQEESEAKLQESYSTESYSQDDYRDSSSKELNYGQKQHQTEAESKDDLHFHHETFDCGPGAVEHIVSSTSSHLKLPQDCFFEHGNALPLETTNDTAVLQALFCVYCGLKCGGPQDLELHLQKCSQFARIQKDGLSTQIELERVMFRMWTARHESETRGGGETGVPIFGAGCSDLDVHEVNQLEIQKTLQKKLDPEVNYFVEKKKCPFCKEVFAKGNEFSSHLLKCTERRRARKQRRRREKESPDLPCDPRIKKCVTPGRRMPWE